MSRPRFERLDAEKRRRILAVAAEEFAARGFANASLNRIIVQAGISKGAAYYYFDDKADLFATVIRDGMESFRPPPGAALDVDALDATTFWPAVLASYRGLLDCIRQQPWLTALGKMFYGPPPSPAVGALVAGQLDLARAWLARIVERGRAVGVVRTDLPGDLLLTMLAEAGEAADRWFVVNRERLDPSDADRLALTLFSALQRLAEPPDGGRATKVGRGARAISHAKERPK